MIQLTPRTFIERFEETAPLVVSREQDADDDDTMSDTGSVGSVEAGQPASPCTKRLGILASISLMSAALLIFATGRMLSATEAAGDGQHEVRPQEAAELVQSSSQASSREGRQVPSTPPASDMLLSAARAVELHAAAGHHAYQSNSSHSLAEELEQTGDDDMTEEDPVAELIAKGPSHLACCRVFTRFSGKIASHMQHWWDTSKCSSFNMTMCDQAHHVVKCCKAQEKYGNIAWKSFGSMPWGDLRTWWSKSGCDEIALRNLSVELRPLLSSLARKQSGGEDHENANLSDDSADEVPKLCELALQVVSEEDRAKSQTHDACSPFFTAPEKPTLPDQHNGVALQDVCFSGEGPFHAFIIGDWGSLWGFKAAKHLGHRHERGQGFVWPVDDHPQLAVRDQMRKLALSSNPDYVLNVGDDFYWGGINAWCGKKDLENPSTDQFKVFFEDLYTGEGLDGKQWLGILGNHDYGGFTYHGGWDQIIGYTWNKESTGRWMNPAQYWRVTVRYPDFAVDYYFLDTNVWDANGLWDHSERNICGYHNGGGAVCPGGPNSTWICPKYFRALWDRQKAWLDEVVPLSTADWRIAVTHFPPYFGKEEWQEIAPKHGIDFVVAGHRHSQFVRGVGDEPVLIWPDWGAGAFKIGYTDFLDPTAWVVSGGGGGITSEHAPSQDGNDDQYGFMDLTLTKENLTVEAYSHTGVLRHMISIEHNYRTTTTTTTTTTLTNTTTSTSTITITTTTTTNETEAGGFWPWR